MLKRIWHKGRELNQRLKINTAYLRLRPSVANIYIKKTHVNLDIDNYIAPFCDVFICNWTSSMGI